MSFDKEYKTVCDKYDRIFAQFIAAKIRAGKYAKNPPAKWEYDWMDKYGIDHVLAFRVSYFFRERNRYEHELKLVHRELKIVSADRKDLRKRARKEIEAKVLIKVVKDLIAEAEIKTEIKARDEAKDLIGEIKVEVKVKNTETVRYVWRKVE